ncbi:MAG: radical SAM protein [Ignavibacteriales bacterium]|nr:radical SAM protein [Ignavibacteriales bacterium]
MKKKIYLVQPSYRDQRGNLLKGKRLYIISLALPALGSAIPESWEKEFCYEYFDEINFDTDASVIGISSMGYEIFRGIEIAAEFRKRGKKVIFGGFQPHISKEYLESQCDSIVHGNPGVRDMSTILNDVESGDLKKEYFCSVDLGYRMNYSYLDTSKVFFTPVVLSVGCRNSCDYCCIGSIYKGKYKLRNLDHVFAELEYLHRRTRRIAVVDTNVYNNREYLMRVCEEMIRRDYKFIWGAQCTIDIGEDAETLQLMRRAGCRILFIGMETIEQANLDAVHKKYSVESYRQKIETIHKSGIRIAAFFMYGLDGDTLETSSQMSKFIIEHRIALPMLNILVPTPGTRIYDRLKQERRILMNDEQDFLKNNIAYNSSFSLCFYEPKNMTPMQVEDGFLDLLRRLSGYVQIVRRSVSKDIPLTVFLLYMNWMFRKEYKELKRRRSAALLRAA